MKTDTWVILIASIAMTLGIEYPRIDSRNRRQLLFRPRKMRRKPSYSYFNHPQNQFPFRETRSMLNPNLFKQNRHFMHDSNFKFGPASLPVQQAHNHDRNRKRRDRKRKQEAATMSRKDSENSRTVSRYRKQRGLPARGRLQRKQDYEDQNFLTNEVEHEDHQHLDYDNLPVLKVDFEPMGVEYAGAIEFDKYLDNHEAYEHDELFELVHKDEHDHKRDPYLIYESPPLYHLVNQKDKDYGDVYDHDEVFFLKPNPLGFEFPKGEMIIDSIPEKEFHGFHHEHHHDHKRPHFIPPKHHEPHHFHRPPRKRKKKKRIPLRIPYQRPHVAHIGNKENLNGGCYDYDGNLYPPGQSWPLSGCGRATCTRSLKSGWEVWEERCEGGIQNPQYACVIESNPRLPFPDCCPRPTQCRDDI